MMKNIAVSSTWSSTTRNCYPPSLRQFCLTIHWNLRTQKDKSMQDGVVDLGKSLQKKEIQLLVAQTVFVEDLCFQPYLFDDTPPVETVIYDSDIDPNVWHGERLVDEESRNERDPWM